jgi:hypothetical protein
VLSRYRYRYLVHKRIPQGGGEERRRGRRRKKKKKRDDHRREKRKCVVACLYSIYIPLLNPFVCMEEDVYTVE